ncbi:MAG TPA: hypothetical protein PLC65_04355, partial [Bacteroidia bacterium]|nr:hypothetical protein [Bacteroidia bacterium]
MSEGSKQLRLTKVAKEFNLSLGKIVEFLTAKGKPVENNPNAKIGEEEYSLLLKEFSSDKSAREEAEQVSQTINKVKRETIVLDDKKAKQKEAEKQAEEVVIKETAPAKVATKTKKVEEEKTEVVKTEVDNLEGPKVLGKVDLSSINTKTKPDKKSKKEAEKTEEEPKKGKKKVEVIEEPVIESPVTETPVVEEEKVDFLETRYEKLDGPKILGKVNLPVKDDKKKPSQADLNADKKKRKRIRKG